MFFINGSAQNFLPADDRSIHFGDGCFTTTRIKDGRISMIDAHINRLQKTCANILIPFTLWDNLRSEMEQLAQRYNKGVLKVIISRGSGGRGYSIEECMSPIRILHLSNYPEHYNSWRQDGITLALSPIKLGRNPVLAGLKHLNRLEQVLIHAYLKQMMNVDEAIVLDSEGYITECCAANLFWRIGKKVFTPKLNQAGVNGVMRQFCLQQLAHSNFNVIEVSTGIEALCNIDEMVICNSLLPVVPVRAYGQHIWSTGKLYSFLAPLCDQT